MSALFRRSLPVLALALAGTATAQQSLNVDVGLNTVFPVPGPTYAGAAAQAGTWNGVSAASTWPVSLVGIDGNPSGVTLSATGGQGDFAHDNASTTGDDDSLMDDAVDVGSSGSTTTWTFSGLANGQYQVITYAWAPDDATYRTEITVTGATTGMQSIGGAWPGSHTLGTTYALHTVDVTSGTLVVTARTADDPIFGFGSLNGFQIKGEGPPPIATYCYGDGTNGACPCSNSGTTGRGCQNSAGTGGARLTATGTPSTSVDTVVMNVIGENPTALTIFLQGDATTSPVNFGDGRRCASGSLKRLYTKNASGGSSTAPFGADPSITSRSAALGKPIFPGTTMYYQTWYRDGSASFCPAPPGNTYNASNGLSIHWN